MLQGKEGQKEPNYQTDYTRNQKLVVALTPNFCINLLEQSGSFTNASSILRDPRALASTSESGLNILFNCIALSKMPCKNDMI